jgi:uncharacterized protein
LQSPKVYFYDTGLVNGDPSLRFENLVACALLKHVQWQQDTLGRTVGLHYIRTKDGAEVDFCLSADDTLSDLIECKLSDPRPHAALTRFATEWPQARATQLVRDLRQAQDVKGIEIRAAVPWLAGLLA